MNSKILNQPKQYSYESYKLFLAELVKNNASSSDPSADHVQATKTGAHRLQRIERQVEITEELKNAITSIHDNWEWNVLIESWCSDGAQNLPIIARIAALSNKINLVISLRDENPELINTHLTNGAKAMPKLICTNKTTQKELGVWGPRPAIIQEKVKQLKLIEPQIAHDDLLKNLYNWYAEDKGLSLQNEFVALIKSWTNLEH